MTPAINVHKLYIHSFKETKFDFLRAREQLHNLQLVQPYVLHGFQIQISASNRHAAWDTYSYISGFILETSAHAFSLYHRHFSVLSVVARVLASDSIVRYCETDAADNTTI